MFADVLPLGEEVRQVLVLGGGLTALFGYGQILFHRQQQTNAQSLATLEATERLRREAGDERRKAELEAEEARKERRAAEHQRRNAEQVAVGAKMQLEETERQLVSCRESEGRLRADVAGYRTEIDALRGQVTELRRIIRVRFSDQPRRGGDDPDIEHERD